LGRGKLTTRGRKEAAKTVGRINRKRNRIKGKKGGRRQRNGVMIANTKLFLVAP